MKRKIIEREYLSSKHCRNGDGSVWLTLECGHEVRKKRSQEPVYCYLCDRYENVISNTANNYEDEQKEEKHTLLGIIAIIEEIQTEAEDNRFGTNLDWDDGFAAAINQILTKLVYKE